MTYQQKALQAADDLLDAYPAIAIPDDSVEIVRNLLAMAWLKGSQFGGSEALDLAFESLKATRV